MIWLHVIKMATSKPPEMNYTCEICGLEGFNDEEMRSHMVFYHLQGAANCPFCDLGEISPTEMLTHVNSAHLDYLTPRYIWYNYPFNLAHMIFFINILQIHHKAFKLFWLRGEMAAKMGLRCRATTYMYTFCIPSYKVSEFVASILVYGLIRFVY